MKKKVAIITLMGNNYGNRLQNYAVQKFLTNQGFETETLKNNYFTNKKVNSLKNKIKYIYSIIKHELLLRDGSYRINNSLFTNERTKMFVEFNKNIIFSKHNFNIKKRMNYDYYFVGSDQVWSPEMGLQDLGLLTFEEDNKKKISFSASIGVNSIPKAHQESMKKYISKFNKLSVREDKGKEIIEELTGRKDIEVLVDPTMLLNSKDWDLVSKKPKNLKEGKYILNYFLGELSNDKLEEIKRIANENDCFIVNLLDKNDPLYNSGPSEFLYLEKNAFLICTDSFHSSVFAIIYNRPFVVFEREQQGLGNMNSRIETLLNKFNLNDRKYNGLNITENNLKCNYEETYRILEIEKEKSRKFVEKVK